MNLVEISHTWQSDGYPKDSQYIFVEGKRELPVFKFTIDYSRHVLEKSRDYFGQKDKAERNLLRPSHLTSILFDFLRSWAGANIHGWFKNQQVHY